MRIAIAAYQNRIAAILESADRLIILDPPVRVDSSAHLITLTDHSVGALLIHLQRQGVKILICGAVSGWLQHWFEANEIQVCCWMTGEVDQVIEALATEKINSPRFLMPGCRRRFAWQHGHFGQPFPANLTSNSINLKGERPMKIGISASGTDLTAQIDPRFGRAEYFIIVDSETMAFEVISNTALQAAHGAGIQAAQLMHEKGVTHLITGSVGPNAMQTLTAANIKIFQANQGTVEAAVTALKNNTLSEVIQAGPAHAGMRGGGRGQGGGRGRGNN
jgi:predicted Fe-Mo cluster-binding NifX family protein